MGSLRLAETMERLWWGNRWWTGVHALQSLPTTLHQCIAAICMHGGRGGGHKALYQHQTIIVHPLDDSLPQLRVVVCVPILPRHSARPSSLLLLLKLHGRGCRRSLHLGQWLGHH